MTVAPPLRRPGSTLVDVALFAAAAFALFIFSQGWVAPFQPDAANLAAESALLRAAFYPAYALGGLIALACAPNLIRTAVRSPMLMLMLAIAVASFVWSFDGAQTLRRSVALLLSTFVALAVAARWDWDGVAEVMATCFAALVVITVVTALTVPTLGRMLELYPGAWRGLWPEKNAMGGNMAIGYGVFLAAAALVPKRRWLWGGFAAAALFLVLMSTSKTSLLCAVLATGAAAFVGLVRRGPVTGIATVLTAVVGVALIGAAALFASDVFFQVLGKDSSLTGRTDIWEPAIRQAMQRPWLGWGYGAVWTDQSGWGALAWITHDAGFRAVHAHNSWIAVFLELGWVGLVALGLFYAQTVGLALWAVFRHRGAWLALPFLVAYSLMTVSEAVAYSYNDMRWMIFVVIAVKLAAPHPRPVAMPTIASRRPWAEPVFRPQTTSA